MVKLGFLTKADREDHNRGQRFNGNLKVEDPQVLFLTQITDRKPISLCWVCTLGHHRRTAAAAWLWQQDMRVPAPIMHNPHGSARESRNVSPLGHEVRASALWGQNVFLVFQLHVVRFGHGTRVRKECHIQHTSDLSAITSRHSQSGPSERNNSGTPQRGSGSDRSVSQLTCSMVPRILSVQTPDCRKQHSASLR